MQRKSEEIIGDHQCGFRRNRSATDHTLCFRQIRGEGRGGAERWAYNEAFHQLFTDSKKAYDSVRKEVLHNILIEFGTPMKMVRLIKMCLD